MFKKRNREQTGERLQRAKAVCPTPVTIADFPPEVVSTIMDHLDVLSATYFLASNKGLWQPGQGEQDLRTNHKILVRSLRYNYHVCLLATHETILRNRENGLRELDTIASSADRRLLQDMEMTSLGTLRIRLQFQCRAIEARRKRDGMRVASICTLNNS
mmetsp:Transcript_8663/g.21116  ORF Transcript_8663/g.21116 Transcript_8663/m.21116 type:complete len:159 (-) Transcript_8663:24-500(-)